MSNGMEKWSAPKEPRRLHRGPVAKRVAAFSAGHAPLESIKTNVSNIIGLFLRGKNFLQETPTSFGVVESLLRGEELLALQHLAGSPACRLRWGNEHRIPHAIFITISNRCRLFELIQQSINVDRI